MNTLKVWLEKYGGVLEEARWPSEHYLISSGGFTLVVCQYKGMLAMWALWSSSESSICSPPGLLSATSMSSSSLLLLSSDEESVLASSSKAGVGAWAHTFKAKARLEVTAGDPNDIGLSEQELRPESLAPQPIPGSAELLTGNPGARPSNAFLPTMMGDIGAGNPRRAKSNGGIVGEVLLKCGSVLGPAALVVVSGEVLDWETNGWLDWDPNPSSGSNTDFASNSSSNVWTRSVSCLGILYGLGWSPPRGLVTGACTQLG